jgi:hypothetical protein
MYHQARVPNYLHRDTNLSLSIYLFNMAPSQISKVAALENFLKDNPHITFVRPSFPSYASLQVVFSLDNTAAPLAIVRPQSASDVALLVHSAKSNGIKFVVWTGGPTFLACQLLKGSDY